MIQLEDLIIGMKVSVTNVGEGVVKGVWVNSGSTSFATIELQCKHKQSFPISMISKINKNEN